MFPYHDENATQRTPYVTLILIGLNVAAWFLVQGAGGTIALARSVCEFGLIPGELTASVSPGTRFPMGEGLVSTKGVKYGKLVLATTGQDLP